LRQEQRNYCNAEEIQDVSQEGHQDSLVSEWIAGNSMKIDVAAHPDGRCAATPKESTLEPALTGDSRLAEAECRTSVGLKKAVSFEPCAGVFGVLFIPAPRATETKTITPVIHVLHEACFARSGKLARQNDLQVTDSTLLEIVTASIAIELRSSRRRHADNVGGLVEQRVNRCIVSNKDLITDNTCFRFSPEAPVDRLTARNQFD
jgi:hypothetical protein